MANTFLIKHGSDIPTTNNLDSWEMGYNSTNSSIYINNNGSIRKVGANNYTQSVTLQTTTTTITLTDLVLTRDCFVYIDVNSSDSSIIKAFRKADLIYSSSSIDNKEIILKVNGKISATVTIPLKITVVY